MFHGEVLFIGGKVSPKHSRVSGSISQQVIQQFHFHKAFVSIDGLLPSFGVSSFELEKAKLSEAMMKLAEKTYTYILSYACILMKIKMQFEK